MEIDRFDGGAGEVDGVFFAMSDLTRRELLDLLAAQESVTATTLAEWLPVSRQAVVKHLAVLAAAGLVAGTRVGREVRYSVQPAALDATADVPRRPLDRTAPQL